jgi:hypothetical protein
MISITLPGHPLGPNRTRRMHWAAVAKERATWRYAAGFAALAARNDFAVPYERASIHLIFRYRRRGRRDRDNLIAASKSLIDGLVGILIVDDDSDHLDSPTVSIDCPSARDEVTIEVTPVTS